MKKLYIIPYIFFLIVLCSLTYASDLTQYLIYYYDFEQDPSTSNLTDQINGTINSTAVDVQGRVNANPINNYAWDFENTSQDNIVMVAGMIDGWEEFTINGWFRLESISAVDIDYLFGCNLAGSITGLITHRPASDSPRAEVVTTGSGEKKITPTDIHTGINKWYMITMRFNKTDLTFWVNGTNKGSIGATGTVNSNGPCYFSRNPNSAGGYTDGLIDEVAIYNISLDESQIAELWNDGTGLFYPFGPITGIPTTPTIQPPSPANNVVNNTNVTLNVSHSSTLNDVRYYLYFGDTSTLIETHLQLNNATRTASEFRNYSTNVSDGTYYWKWRVQNITDGTFSLNTTQRTWTLDTTNPTITLNEDNSFDSNSVSRINQYANYLFFNITAADETGLFGFLVNVTKGGISYYNYTNISFTGGNLTFNFSQNVSTSSWGSGVYNVNITVSDSHTVLAIKDYDISQFLGKITFGTSEGNEISISGNGAYSTEYTKRKDRYEFGFDYLTKKTDRKFTIKAKNKIYYLPNSKYIGHFVIMSNGVDGNWLDFEGIGNDYFVEKKSDYEYEISFINLPDDTKIRSKSLGGVNKVTETYKWYRGNYTEIFPTASTFGNLETFSLNITRNLTYANPNATFTFNGTLYDVDSTVYTDYILFSRDITISRPSGASQSLPFFWNVTINQSINNSEYSFKVSNTVNISESLLDNCSVYNTTILVISGKDEETNENTNLTLNILFTPSIIGTGINNSYELSGSINYSFCSDSITNFTLDSIMEYGDGTVYTNRKYYLNNFSIDTSTINEVFLYHLNNSKASEIVFTVFDTTTGDRISGAFIKILRFYPGEDVFRIVEIGKTDEVGQTLGKMVLADVFYKFIIEKPAGTVKLDTGVLRILSLTRSFGISFVEDVLDTWDKIHDVSYSTTCTKGTKTCRVTWSDSSNIVQSVTLEVWRVTGLADKLLSSQTTTAAAGTISYTVTEDTATNTYEARAFARSTNPSDWNFGRARFFYSDNPFFTDPEHRIASLFPLFLLVVVIIFALIDWGVIGIVVGSLLGLVIGSIIGILPIDPFYLISFILMAIILIYKLSK